MIDYSKWNHLSCSSSDEEDAFHPGYPKVTRFDEPQSITLGGNEYMQNVNAKASGSSRQICDGRISMKHQNVSTEKFLNSKSEPKESRDSLKTEGVKSNVTKEDILDFHESSLNGGFGQHYVWSQTKSEVKMIYWNLPPYIKGRDMNIAISDSLGKGQEDDHRDFPEAGKPSGRYLTVLIQGKSVLEKRFPYPVLLDDQCIFWEVKTFQGAHGANIVPQEVCDLPSLPFRSLILQVTKLNIISSAVLWWDCFFMNDPTIDVTAIHERQADKVEKQKVKFREAWEQAHTSFRELVKHRGA